jgi:hypothetical protein
MEGGEEERGHDGDDARCSLPPPPPPHYILLILSYLKLKVYLEREIEREERKIYLVKGLHLVRRIISSKERLKDLFEIL